jgi:hypothetical protein
MRTRKSWREKMDNPDLPKVVDIPPKMQARLGSGTLLIPSPRDVDTAIRQIRRGTVKPVSKIRADLAAKYETDSACPLCTGIFVRIVAEAAEEDSRNGKLRITPYWRVVKDDGSLNPKFPGGVVRQAERLRGEGLRVVAGKGKKPPRVSHEPRP